VKCIVGRNRDKIKQKLVCRNSAWQRRSYFHNLSVRVLLKEYLTGPELSALDQLRENGSPNHGPATSYQKVEEATFQSLPQVPEANPCPPSPLQDLSPAAQDRLTNVARVFVTPVSCFAAGATA
jgi:hypothetical protein